MQPVVLIARLIGPLFAVIGIGMLLNQKLYADMIGQAVMVPVMIYLYGMLSFTAGVAMLNGYRAWTPDWRIIVTILGWLLVIGGIVRIVVPAVTASLALSIFSVDASMAIGGVIVIVIGAFLTFEGYWRAK